jgi:hypothetical protein
MAKSVRAFLFGLVAVAAISDGRVVAAVPRPGARVVAIGDIHGDRDAFVGILQRTGLLASNLTWSGRNTTLVQLGDMIDRGPKSRAVMDLLMRLQKEAPRQGGRVIVLMGNHETLNIYGDLDYVTPSDYASFVDTKSEDRRASAYRAYEALHGKSPPASRDEWMRTHPPGFVEQREAFGPDGKYGKWIRTLPAVARIDDSIFLHGGISPDFASWQVDKINQVIAAEIQAFDAYKRFMVDEQIALPFDTLKELASAARAAVDRKVDALTGFLAFDGWVSVREDGPLWFRGYAQWSDAEGAPLMDQVVRALGVARVVVGHTVQAGEIRSRFGGQAYLIDTAMLAGFVPGGRASALVIEDGHVTVTYAHESSPVK